MALILNIETSTTVCSVALAKDGELVALKESFEERSHATLLTVFIDEIFKENKIQASNLDAVAVSEGPGSYTGLRIGVSTAKGIAYGAGIPLLAVGTLESMANGYLQQKSVAENTLLVPMLDARRLEVYTAIWNTKMENKMKVQPMVIDENSLKEQADKQALVLFGTGAEKCKPILCGENFSIDTEYTISAKDMIALAEKKFEAGTFEDVAYFEPFYLKEFMATIPKKKF